MAINLTKGQRIDVSLQQVLIGLAWDINDGGGSDFDLDAAAFLLGENERLVSDEHLVFYNNKKSPDGAVVIGDDDRSGEGGGDDEVIAAELLQVSPAVHQILFTVSIHDYAARRQNFGQVRNSVIRIYNAITRDEIAKYELDEDFSTESAVEFGRLYRRGGAWKFEAVGRGCQGGLEALVNKYAR
jgi:tellurium resistance protein TerD